MQHPDYTFVFLKFKSKMMYSKLKTLIAMLIMAISFHQVSSQDIHFSQFSMSPLLLNPALAGMNQGDYRAYANFRTQWNTVAGGNAYRTFIAGGDLAFAKRHQYSSFGGIGISFFSDQAGITGFQTNRVDLTLAYHIVMSRRRHMSLSFGIQGGFNHMGFDPSKATYDYSYDQASGYINTYQKETFTRTKIFFGDVGAGLFYNVNINRGTDIYLGGSIAHINQPVISFNTDPSIPHKVHLYMKLTLHGGATAQLGDRSWLIPNFFIMIQGPAQQYNIGSLIKLQTGNKVLSKTYFYIGAQARITRSLASPMADAIIVHTRLDYRGFTLGLSYDVNISKLRVATSTFGAPEISIMYTGANKHRPNPVFCPYML